MPDLPPMEAGPYALVAAILDCPVADVTAESSITTHPKWDSFAQLDIMMSLSERFGIPIDEDSIGRYSSMAPIVVLYEAKTRG